MASDRVQWTGWPVLVHSLRTAVAAVASVLVARLFRLPETYWAAITTLVITQSSLGAALAVSWQRFVGIALAIVLLIPRTSPAWQIAFRRFAEVSIGIAVALIMTVVWPEREITP